MINDEQETYVLEQGSHRTVRLSHWRYANELGCPLSQFTEIS